MEKQTTVIHGDGRPNHATSTRFKELAAQIEANANTATPMPSYRCHKEVWALKIKEIEPAPKPTIAELEAILREDPSRKESRGAIIVPEGHFGPIAVSLEFVTKHRPQPGGYLVFYKDGYRSFSPAEAFESGYTRI
jgi:hypothetical protein